VVALTGGKNGIGDSSISAINLLESFVSGSFPKFAGDDVLGRLFKVITGIH
jgi:hypothetical protein